MSVGQSVGRSSVSFYFAINCGSPPACNMSCIPPCFIVKTSDFIYFQVCKIKNVLKLNLKSEKNKNILRTFEAENRYIFKNIQPGLQKHGSYKVNRVYIWIAQYLKPLHSDIWWLWLLFTLFRILNGVKTNFYQVWVCLSMSLTHFPAILTCRSRFLSWVIKKQKHFHKIYFVNLI